MNEEGGALLAGRDPVETLNTTEDEKDEKVLMDVDVIQESPINTEKRIDISDGNSKDKNDIKTEEKIADNETKEKVKHQFVVPVVPKFIKKSNCDKEKSENDNVSKILNENVVDVDDGSTTVSSINEHDDKGCTKEEKDRICDGSSTIDKSIPNIKPKIKTISKKIVEFPYQEPPWAGTPPNNYSLTVLKEGIVKDTIDLNGKSIITFGRLQEACDVLIEHPSCSRFHAVLLYCAVEKEARKVGYYLYDMGSTHGSSVNKEKVKPKVYVRVRVGYQIKFGGSSRLYIVEGPEEDQEEEIDMEEVKEMRRLNKFKLKMTEMKKNAVSTDQIGSTKGEDDTGASWGFREDAVEEELDLEALMEKKKKIEVKDPKKTLRGFFEREGIDFEYEMSERGRGNSVIHVAHVRLPIESSFGVEVIAEGTSSCKKDAVINCATDACKIIQAYDMMQNTCKEDQRLKRQRELEANDFYDSDDDNYLDRTGSVEKKRLKRKRMAGKVGEQVVETHETLIAKLDEKSKLLLTLEEKLNTSSATSDKNDEDSLDAYMSSVKNQLDKKSEMKIKRQVRVLKEEMNVLKKLVEKTQPALPAFTLQKQETAKPTTDQVSEENLKSIRANPNFTVSNKTQKKTEKPTSEVQDASDVQEVHENKGKDKDTVEVPKVSSEKKKVYGVAMPPKKKNAKRKEGDFIEWLPPENQTGDGRTHLNEKLGY